MLTKKNIVILEGGLTRDAEVFENTGVVHLSIGVDSSGSEKGVQNPSGYFDVKIWLNPSAYTPAATAENVKKYLEEGLLCKGTRISIVGRLVQERWLDKNNSKSTRVVVVAEAVDVFRSKTAGSAPAGSVEQAVSMSASSDIDEF